MRRSADCARFNHTECGAQLRARVAETVSKADFEIKVVGNDPVKGDFVL